MKLINSPLRRGAMRAYGNRWRHYEREKRGLPPMKPEAYREAVKALAQKYDV